MDTCWRGYLASLPACVDNTSSSCPLSGPPCSGVLGANETASSPPWVFDTVSCLSQICDLAAEENNIDVDIIGLGVRLLSAPSPYIWLTPTVQVFISYCLQLGLGCILGFPLIFPPTYRRSAQDIIARAIENCVEFQKAQCYFLIAIQIASIVQLESETLQFNTLGRAQGTLQLVTVITNGSCLPVIAIILLLRWQDHKSRYPLLLADVTIVLSLIVRYLALGPTAAAIKNVSTDQSQFLGCKNMNPVSLCASTSKYIGSVDVIEYVSLGVTPCFCTIAIYITLEQFGIWNHVPAFLRSGWTAFVLFSIITVSGMFHSWGLILIAFDVQPWISSNTPTWSFGQIVAVTVGVPVIVQVMYRVTCKESSSRKRL